MRSFFSAIALLLSLSVGTGLGAPAVSVSDEMEAMQDSFRQIKRGLREQGDFQEMTKQAEIFRKATQRCLDTTPDFILRAPDNRRATLEKEYRLGLVALDKEMEKLMKTLQTKDTKAAAEVVKRIDQQRREGHERLGVDD